MSQPTRVLRCAALLTRQGWLEPAYVTVDAAGLVVAVAAAAPRADAGSPPVTVEDLGGFVIPGFQNAHSHAFQYAMAGLAEHLPAGAAADDFWSWRDAMYRLALSLDPEAMEAVAGMLYAEMLRFGITSVAEFHYLHLDPAGKPYADAAEMGQRLMAAAATAGIELTLLPVFYQQGGFGQAASPLQRRFLSRSIDDYARLLTATRAAAAGVAAADVVVGIAVHSLRAVAPGDVIATLSARDAAFAGPAHIHVAEQRKEVDDCVAALGQRPVAWLLANTPVDERLHLVHATHMTDDEAVRLAATGAGVVLCPSTEGNLGDGFFPLAAYHAAGGRYAIGSDSHIGLSPLEELRWIDYGQRLRVERRNVLCKPGEDSGALLIEQTWRAGRRAMGRPADAYFAPGSPFDAVVLDPTHPTLQGKPADRRLSAVVYAGDPGLYAGVLRRGRWVVKDQRHVRSAALRTAYGRALAGLRTGN